MHRLPRFAAAVLFLVPGSVVLADETDQEFRKNKTNLIREFSSPKKEVRAAVVKKFESYLSLEAAKVLLDQAERNKDPDVRRDCQKLMPAFADVKGVAAWLQGDFVRSLKADKIDETDLVRFGVLLAAKEKDGRQRAQSVMTDLGRTPAGLVHLIGIVDRAAAADNEEGRSVILNIAQSADGVNHLGFRRALTQALATVQEKEALDALIELLPGSSGEARVEIAKHFKELSGGNLALETDWPKWWKDNRGTFDFAAAKAENKLDAAPPLTGPSYYGLPLYGSRIVFIIDTSGSMSANGRMDRAKTELLKAINGLGPGTQFNVIAFNSIVVPWQKQALVPVSNQSKQAAAEFVAGLRPTGQTASYDALEAALACGGDAIYFLTDGAPGGGKTSNPQEIVTLISQANRVCRATIYSIGIGSGLNAFLTNLSAKNFGQFREVQ